MKFLRPLLALALLLILIAAAWLWWALPSRVDMAGYAPADSLVYVEFNNLSEVAQAIQQSDVWQAAAPITGSKTTSRSRFMMAAARAGIGPLEAVVFARAQVALVVVDLNATEENDTLRVRPEVALIAETHTSKWRTKTSAAEVVRKLANFAYGASMCSERTGDADYVECSIAGGERKIVGAVDGTLVVIGNSDNAVRSCLEARRGSRPNMRTDTELLKVRSNFASDKTLGFGYISPANSAKLFSWAAPLLMHQAPGNPQTASPTKGGLEDRFLFSLEPGVVQRLQPAFETAGPDENIWKLIPQSFQSVTIYRSKAPAVAWSSLGSAVSFKLDAVPAVLFGELLRSSLSVYGIDNPKEVLTTLSPPLLTLRPSTATEGSILVARVSDEAKLRRSLMEDVFKDGKGEILEGLESNPSGDKEFAAVFADGYVLLGRTENMRSGLAALRTPETDRRAGVKESAHESSAPIVTYSNDEERLNNFITTLLKLQGRSLSSEEAANLQNTLRRSGFSSTETRLNAFGIERTTRSAFGQFGTLVSLLQADSSAR
jgi:hypothetical protein